MDWNTSTLWWLATGVLVAAELATGTFYLLMVALGCAAGAVAAILGMGSTLQIVVAALIGSGATIAWHLLRQRAPRPAAAESNRDVNLDIGESVTVQDWTPEGVARVHYRGAAWSARYAGNGTPQPGVHVIVALHGNELRVTPAAAH